MCGEGEERGRRVRSPALQGSESKDRQQISLVMNVAAAAAAAADPCY